LTFAVFPSINNFASFGIFNNTKIVFLMKAWIRMLVKPINEIESCNHEMDHGQTSRKGLGIAKHSQR
jgi:hypothetical protein